MNRPTIAEQEDLVKESLFKFLRKHIPSAQLSSIDEIVLRYVVSILEDLGTEASVEEAFDVEGFCEMMAAYFPEFSTIHHTDVCQWMFELEATLSQKKRKDECNSSDSFAKDIPVLTLQTLVPTRNHGDSESSGGGSGDTTKRVHQLSENSDGSSDSSGDYYLGQEEPQYDAAQVQLLQEMFPSACTIEVRHCLAIAEGDVGRAAQLVLHRQEAGQSLTSHSPAMTALAQRQKAVVDDQELKSRIIARYSYVDKDDDVREHRPVGPKAEPKKLVRYRDNKIVSLKGERFTEVKKDDEEDVKKTYVSIKPARQYRFH
ncbi:CUE domain-containing protein 2 [Schistocerca gregaria]|uniref:CUE domain-containing protein 2 n=1 Tax=Schistocerca gregaria TaxID=7010 RepID=UPI00211EA2B9|nr:CUE domain-containing protein 2 [Schistocerca gregaria]